MTTKTLLSLAAAAAALALPLESASARTWTDARTGNTLEADFVRVEGGTVTLRRANGSTVEVPLARLSDSDQAFIKQAAAGGGGGAADWPTWRGADRTGRSPATGLLKEWPEGGPELLWTFTDGGKGYSSPAIVDGKLYFTGSRDGKAEIICLEVESGDELWSAAIGNDPEDGYETRWGAGTRGAPTVSEGLVFAMSANGEVACVSAEDGSKEWSVNLVEDFGGSVPDWGYSESPLADGGKLIVTPGGEQGAIVALDKKTGKTIWQSEELTDKAQYASVVPAEVDGTRQYIQLFMKTLAGVNAETGELLWTSDWPGRTAVIPTPIYHDGHVYITAGYRVGCKLVNIEGGQAKDVWSNRVMVNHHGGVIRVGDHVYGFSDPGVTCQEFMTGERVWNESGAGKSKGAVAYADGMFYGLDEQERSAFLFEATPDGYKEHGRFTLPKESELRRGTSGKVWTHPVVIGGRLYLRDQEFLFCYDVRK